MHEDGQTSLDAVAAEARVTKGAVYHDFQGKPQLGSSADHAPRRIARDGMGWRASRRGSDDGADEITIAAAVQDGRIAPRPAGPLAVFLYGVLCETSMSVARADNQKAAHHAALTELSHELNGLRLD